jgi:Ala-tRNA(Pro) deacylase
VLERLWLQCLRLKQLMSSNELDISDFYISPDGPQLAIPTGTRKSDKLIKFLDENGICSKTYNHSPVNTPQGEQRLRQSIPGTHTKTLFLQDGDNNYFLFTTDDNLAVSIDTLARAIDVKGGSLSVGSPSALMELLEIGPESLSALAVINDVAKKVAVVIDERLMKASAINCRPLTNRRTTSLSKNALVDFLATTGHTPRFVSLQVDG